MEWLEQRCIHDAYHPVCNCRSYECGYKNDPATAAWFLGVCPKRYPFGLHRFVQNILIVDRDDLPLLELIQSIDNFGIMSYLSDLEYYVYDEFHTLLLYPITMFKFTRYSKRTDYAIELSVKVIGLANKKVPVTANILLGDVNGPFTFDECTRLEWKRQIFFLVCTAIARDYFDKFLTIHNYLDLKKEYDN